ncbi:MAG: multiheme c-type cytochrome [Balneolaceae bacterium]|nr:multiheme c-type cytochrome [Balneolaceae bacterium]
MNTKSQHSSWSSKLLYLVSGLLLFEILTGLSISFLPFSLSNQVMVLLHTAAGLIFMFPYLWYQFKHWMKYKDRPLNEFSVTGYVGMAATTTAIITGIVLTWQALFTSSIGTVWKNVHLISTFVLIASVIPHVFLIIWRDSKVQSLSTSIRSRLTGQKRFGFNSIYLLLIQFLLVGLFMFAYSKTETSASPPQNYQYHQNSDSPFYPSLASTADSSLTFPRVMGGSESCGSAGCHKEIKEEWEVSAHRYSASDPFFRKIQENMGELKGPVAARYCGGCHDPIGLFSGSANLYSDSLTHQTGINEGVSCISCHAISEADVQGNADYVLDLPERYLFELGEGKTSKLISDFLIRAYPDYHIESYNRPLIKTSEYCGSCHKQYVDEDINNVGWVQLQNQYDQWRKSHWFSENEPFQTIECRECHMPLVESLDPSSGDRSDYNRTPDDGKHRSHRFLGGNQFVPKLLDLPNADEHVQMIEEWLRGEYEIPEIQDKWEGGPVVPITIISPDTTFAGEKLRMDVLINNRKAGHEFPTGPLDMIQAWIDMTVTDQHGNVLFASGKLDENHFIEPGAFVFKAEPVDQYGNLIDRHNLWEMVGVRYSRALFPGKSDYARFSMMMEQQEQKHKPFSDSQPASYTLDSLPPGTSQIEITAKLQYRKFNQFLMNEVFSDIKNYDTSPVTTISEHSKTVTILPREIQ